MSFVPNRGYFGAISRLANRRGNPLDYDLSHRRQAKQLKAAGEERPFFALAGLPQLAECHRSGIYAEVPGAEDTTRHYRTRKSNKVGERPQTWGISTGAVTRDLPDVPTTTGGMDGTSP